MLLALFADITNHRKISYMPTSLSSRSSSWLMLICMRLWGISHFYIFSLVPPTILLHSSTWYLQTSSQNLLPELPQASVNYFAYLCYNAKFFTAANHYFSW